MLKTVDAYVGSFEKKSGEERSMRFVKVGDLPEEFMASRTKGGKTYFFKNNSRPNKIQEHSRTFKVFKDEWPPC